MGGVAASQFEWTNRVAERICETQAASFAPDVIAYSKVLALSALGAMVAGSKLPTGQRIARYVKRMGGTPEATVAGIGFRTSVESAALANGTFIHATEYEDGTYPEAVSAGTLFPPILALGEKLGVSGERVLEAFIVGYEVQSRLARDCKQAVPRGYLTLSLCGVLGVAAAAAKLLSLDGQQTRMALSLAASQGCGLIKQVGYMAHYFEMGVAGRDGLAAALLAAEGLTASSNVLEGAQGFCELMTGGQVTNPEDVVNNWGAPFRVMDVVIKKYPCCSQIQRLIEGISGLKRDLGVQAAEVESVAVEANRTIRHSMKFPDPMNGDQSRFSIAHCVGVTFLEEEISLKSFSDEIVRSDEYRSFRSKVKTVPRDNWDWGSGEPIPVTVLLKDGRKFAIECAAPDGAVSIQESENHVRHRHRVCVEHIIGQKKTDESIQLILGLEKLDNINKLTAIVA